ncbi:MAG: glycosyltransferase [Stellaceae bacterium]
MWLLAATSIIALLVGVCLWRIARQFRLYESLHSHPPPPDSCQPLSPSVAIVIPARNEAHNIAACLRSLLRQDYPADRFRIIVVDDHSQDDTAAIVRRFAAADSRVRSMSADPLPEGWAGKTNACWCGAVSADAEWLCFIDADTRAEPALLRTAVAAARERKLTMVSLEPFQELHGFFNRLVIPVGFLAIAATQDLARVNAPIAESATANGQFILIRARSYFALGGHAAVRGAISEDAALARRVKSAGLPVAVLGAETLIRTRMYRGAPDLWEGLSKNVTEIYGGPVRTLATALGGLLIGWSAPLLPVAAAAAVLLEPGFDSIAGLPLAIASSAATFATAIALSRHFRVPRWYGLLFPVGMSIAALIALNGISRRARGRVVWKGRIYNP